MWYEVRSRRDIQSFLDNDPSTIPSHRVSPNIHRQPSIGFYHLFTHQHRAYLSSCINSRGGSTVTVSQFRHNRNTYDFLDWRLKERVTLWLQGQGKASVRDRRCLWVGLSVLLNNSSLEATYQNLEKAWYQ